MNVITVLLASTKRGLSGVPSMMTAAAMHEQQQQPVRVEWGDTTAAVVAAGLAGVMLGRVLLLLQTLYSSASSHSRAETEFIELEH